MTAKATPIARTMSEIRNTPMPSEEECDDVKSTQQTTVEISSQRTSTSTERQMDVRLVNRTGNAISERTTRRNNVAKVLMENAKGISTTPGTGEHQSTKEEDATNSKGCIPSNDELDEEDETIAETSNEILTISRTSISNDVFSTPLVSSNFGTGSREQLSPTTIILSPEAQRQPFIQTVIDFVNSWMSESDKRIVKPLELIETEDGWKCPICDNTYKRNSRSAAKRHLSKCRNQLKFD